VPVDSGSRTLKDALNEAMRDWVTNVENTFYIIGTVAGPHPYPMMVRDFKSVVGKECIEQMPQMAGRQPMRDRLRRRRQQRDGHLLSYIDARAGALVGVEAAGEGLATMRTRRACSRGRPGVLHGNRTYLLQDENGQITETHSVSPASTTRASAPSTRG
jgi:tryptophan synthase beta chain